MQSDSSPKGHGTRIRLMPSGTILLALFIAALAITLILPGARTAQAQDETPPEIILTPIQSENGLAIGVRLRNPAPHDNLFVHVAPTTGSTAQIRSRANPTPFDDYHIWPAQFWPAQDEDEEDYTYSTFTFDEGDIHPDNGNSYGLVHVRVLGNAANGETIVFTAGTSPPKSPPFRSNLVNITISKQPPAPNQSTATLNALGVRWAKQAAGEFESYTDANRASYGYRVRVADKATHVKLIPAATHADATVEIGKITYDNGVKQVTLEEVARGGMTPEMPLNPSGNTLFEVKVSHGGYVDTYIVSVQKAIYNAPEVPMVAGSEMKASTSGARREARGHSLTITATSSNDAIATVTVDEDQSKLTVVAVSEGTATITVNTRDSNGNTVSDAFDVSVVKAPEKQETESPTGTPTVAQPIADIILKGPTPRKISLSGVFNDPDGDGLIITAVSSHHHIASMWVTPADPSLTVVGISYGTATITVTAQDPDGNTVSDRFKVTVAPRGQGQQSNRAPTVARAIANATIVNESATHSVSLSGVFADADNDSLTITAASSNEAVATVSVASGGSSLTVSAQSRGTATITVTADDGNGGRVSDTFTAKVKAAPTVASPIGDVSSLEVGATEDVSLSGVFSDPDNDTLTITAASSNNAIATVAVSANGSSLTLAGMTQGTATITVTAQDSDGNQVSDQFRVTVAALQQQEQTNRAPAVSSPIADATIVNQSGTKAVSLSGVFTDADSDSLTITASSSNTAVATVSVAANYSSLTVTAKARGTATITVTASDGKGGTVADTFTVTVKAAPVVASAINDVSGLEAGATRGISLSGVFNDADGDSLTYAVESSAQDVAWAYELQGTLTVLAVASGTTTITVTAQDSDGNRVSDRFSVTVPAPQQQEQPNRAPTVASPIGNATIVHDRGTHSVSLSGVFADADSDALTITAVSSDTAKATVSVTSGYSILTVTAKGQGTTEITVTADDGNGGTVADAFTVTVKAAPTVASAIGDISNMPVGDTQEIDLAGVFADGDGDSLSFTTTSSSDTTVEAILSQGTLTVIAVSEGTATVTVTAQDIDGNRVSDTFNVQVVKATEEEKPAAPAGAPTVAQPLTDLSLKGPTPQVISLSGVFNDPDGDELTITAVSSAYSIATMWVAFDYSTLTVIGISVGTATITVTARDADGNEVSDQFEVSVSPNS